MIKKILSNYTPKILFIAGYKFFVFLIYYSFKNLKKIIISKNLESLNRCFNQISLNFKKNKFFFDIKKIDLLSEENNSFGLIREIYFRDVYLRFFKFENPKNINCVDIGCNIGMFSVLASKIFKDVKSIDMNIKYIEPYKRIMSDNFINNAQFFNYFVGSEHLLVEKNQDIKALDFNKFINKEKLKNIFLKIDIEGFEFNLFENINLEDVSAISMEIHQNHGNIDVLIDKISNNNFMFILTNDLGDVVKDKKKATYIFASKIDSKIKLI